VSAFTSIDLAALPAPQSIIPLDYEAVLADMVSRYALAVPELAENINLESDPVRKLLEIVAYEKTLFFNVINQATKANMVAYAVAADLDNLAALIPLLRNEGESDTDFRVRVQLAPEGFSVAGPRGAYEFHARSADPAVLDVAIDTYDEANVAPGAPTLGEVHVYVLAAADGTLPAEVQANVEAVLNDGDVRPLTDQVSIKAPLTENYDITAELSISSGPSAATVIAAAQTAVQAYVSSLFVFGGTITRSGIIAAVHVAGVVNVNLVSPANDLAPTPITVPVNTAINISEEAA